MTDDTLFSVDTGAHFEGHFDLHISNTDAYVNVDAEIGRHVESTVTVGAITNDSGYECTFDLPVTINCDKIDENSIATGTIT